jgi:hypothetical protein
LPQQEALTIVANVRTGSEPALGDVLTELRDNPARNTILPFAALSDCHFGRVLFLPKTRDLHGQPLSPRLLLLGDCDGSADHFLEALVDTAGAGLDRLFEHCDGYPAERSRQARLSFLQQNSLRIDANYVHRPGRSVEQIREEAKLHAALRAYLDREPLTGVPAIEVRRRLQAFVAGDPELSFALEPAEGLSLGYQLRKAAQALAYPLGFTALSPVALPALALLLALVRLHERRDVSDHVRPSLELVHELAALEDILAHSGFTAGGFVKPGAVRQAVIRGVLPLIGYGTRHLFTRDSLAGVKTIHFARWIPLDDYRRVIFCSNYDGSLESYNNDFINLVAWGLNLVFSNGYGYPKTEWLLFGGASREQEFKDFLRCHQIPTPIWYSAYPELTAVNVERNAALRRGFSGKMNEREARAWLRLL